MADSKKLNGWENYQIFVLSELDRLDKEIDTIQNAQGELIQQLASVKAELAGLKVQSGIWGMIAGAIPVAIAVVIKWITG